MNFQIGDKIRVKPISELKKLFKKNATKDSMGWYYTYKLSDGSNRRIYFALSMEDACEEVPVGIKEGIQGLVGTQGEQGTQGLVGKRHILV